jgi:hypothetical protein
MSVQTYNDKLNSRHVGFVYIVSYRQEKGIDRRDHPSIAFLSEAEAIRACEELKEKVQPVPLFWYHQQLPVLKFKETIK